MKRSRREAWEKPWSAMGREGRRGREPYGAGGAGRAEGAEREGAAVKPWEPWGGRAMEPWGHEPLRVRGMGP